MTNYRPLDGEPNYLKPILLETVTEIKQKKEIEKLRKAGKNLVDSLNLIAAYWLTNEQFDELSDTLKNDAEIAREALKNYGKVFE